MTKALANDSSAVPTDYEHRVGALAYGDIDRQLEIGGVLRNGMAFDACARGFESGEQRGVDRVEVADDDMNVVADLDGVGRARIGGDHQHIVGCLDRGGEVNIGRGAAEHHDRGADRRRLVLVLSVGHRVTLGSVTRGCTHHWLREPKLPSPA
jgi:hypothetical protein